jgi:putative ribosome biogenesis GTPase RsgA
MYRHSENIYTNFQATKHLIENTGKKVYAFQLGRCGVGKSSLLNNLCLEKQ